VVFIKKALSLLQSARFFDPTHPGPVPAEELGKGCGADVHVPLPYIAFLHYAYQPILHCHYKRYRFEEFLCVTKYFGAHF